MNPTAKLVVLFVAVETESQCGREDRLRRLVQSVTGSRLTHVSVGFDGYVLERSPAGSTYCPLWTYTDNKPGLSAGFEIPAARAPDLSVWEGVPPADRRDVRRRWSSGGLFRCWDCVSVTADVLRRAGEPVPQSIVSPGQLFDLLTERGHRLVRF